MRRLMCLGLALSTALSMTARAAEANLTYLNSLLTPITVEGQTFTGLAIYADPDPARPGAYVLKDAPGEGFMDLDDIARAVVVYARDGSAASLRTARDLLELTLKLQAPDGEFYNFLYRDGTINRDGQTSFKSAGFWASRGLWGIAEALPAFEKADPAFAARLQQAFDLGVAAFARDVDAKYGTYRTLDGVRVPAWLPQDGTDIGSNLVVGLATYLKTHPGDAAARQLAARVAEGIQAFMPGTPDTYPFGLPLPNTRSLTEWHAWGARQVQALALAGQVLGKPEFIASARRAAAHPLLHLLVSGGPVEKLTPAPQPYPQIAYGMEAIASGYYALADATGEEVWNELGGLWTAWLYGLNDQRLPLYDPATGRTYDGLERGYVNISAGAESNVTALLAVQQADRRPGAAKMLRLQEVERRADLLLEAEKGDDFGSPPPTRSHPDASAKTLAVLKGGGSVTLSPPPPGRYLGQLLGLARPTPSTLRVDTGGQTRTLTFQAEAEGMRAAPLGMLTFAAGAPVALTQTGTADAGPDALWLFPEVAHKLYASGTGRTALYKSWSAGPQPLPTVPAGAEVRVFDASGAPAGGRDLPPYGFALARWTDVTYTAPAGREARTVTLTAAQQVGKNVLINLAPLLNTDAFSTASEPRRGNLDNPGGQVGATFPAERAPKAGVLTVEGAVYLFPDPLTRPNVYTSGGERLALPPGPARALHLLATVNHGPLQASAQLHFADGASLGVPLNVSDWCRPPQFGEKIAAPFTARRMANGSLESLSCSVYSVTILVPEGRVLIGLTLPDRVTLHVFGITVERP